MGALLKGGEVIELVGDIGTGKTTFVQGILHGLGCKDTVTSPTFTLSREYVVRDGLIVRHFDLYRLSGHDIATDELEEEFDDPSVITLVEWAQQGEARLPKGHIVVQLSYDSSSENMRSISIMAGQALVGGLVS